MLTQKELKELLHYNPETGVFTWKVRRGTKKEGDIAGSLHKTGYRNILIKRKSHRSHRLAWLYMTGSWPLSKIDHINGVKDDNRWDNLREATQQQNSFNKASWKRGTSEYKGVSYHKLTRKWMSQAMVNGVKHYLGVFDCEHEAALVYNQFAMKYHGEYARFNQVYSNLDVVVGKGD